MAARQATERIIDLRYTLHSFGVPLDGPAWLFGDNKSVVTSSTIPHSTLGNITSPGHETPLASGVSTN
eukprot:scaffold11521_cov122-Amphora_coffeaeformis.AAC.1